MAKRSTAPLACLLASIALLPLPGLAYEPQAGDIVFHTSRSSQSEAIQAATGSPWSHMGVVLFKDGRAQVFEAVQPVKFTPLHAWLDRGVDGHYVVKRPRRPLSPEAVERMQAQASRYRGKPYDLAFEWSDQRIYCSELVWKLYRDSAGIELGALQRLGDFKLDHPAVAGKLAERYGDRIPRDEPVIAPVAIFDSPLLETVAERGPRPRSGPDGSAR